MAHSIDGCGRPVFRKSDGASAPAARRFCYGFDSRPCATSLPPGRSSTAYTPSCRLPAFRARHAARWDQPGGVPVAACLTAAAAVDVPSRRGERVSDSRSGVCLHTVVSQNRNISVARRTVEFAVHLPSASVHARLSDLEICTTTGGGCADLKSNAFKKLNAVKTDVYRKHRCCCARRQR